MSKLMELKVHVRAVTHKINKTHRTVLEIAYSQVFLMLSISRTDLMQPNGFGVSAVFLFRHIPTTHLYIIYPTAVTGLDIIDICHCTASRVGSVQVRPLNV